MLPIRVAILSRDQSLGHKIEEELSIRNIVVEVDYLSESDPIEVNYDFAVASPNCPWLDVVKYFAHCFRYIYVLNGQSMTNETLKDLLRIKIAGFIDDHFDVTKIVDAACVLWRTRQKYDRINQKMKNLNEQMAAV